MKDSSKTFRLKRSYLLVLLPLGMLLYAVFCGEFRAKTGYYYKKEIAYYILPSILIVLACHWHPVWKGKVLSKVLFMALAIAAGWIAFQQLTWATLWRDFPFEWVALSITAALYLLMWALIWDVRGAGLTAYWMLCLFAYAYECVWRFRGAALKPMDFLTIGTGLRIAANYTFHFKAKHLYWISVGVLLHVLATKVSKGKAKGRKVKIGKLVLVSVALAWVLVMIFTPVLGNIGAESTAYEYLAWDVNTHFGTITTLMHETHLLLSIHPEHYNAEQLALQDERFSVSGFTCEGTEELPHVIVIMSEAFTNPNEIWKLDTDGLICPYFTELSSETLSGKVYVSVHGGTTCNTEHSFLTGTPPVPQTFMPLLATVQKSTPSIAWQMKALGYTTIAFHPNVASNYSRNRIYPRLGFDEFLSIKDMDNPETVRSYVSDRAFYQKIIELFEEREENEKLFLFTISMQDHGPYCLGFPDAQELLPGAGEEMEEYLNLLRLTDQSLEELIAYFEKQEEPVVLLFFGDHAPYVPFSEYEPADDLEDWQVELNDYCTPFFIWSNQGFEAEDLGSFSVNYLPFLLMDKANLPMTGYDEWSLELSKQYPVVLRQGYVDENRQFVLWSDAEQIPEVLQVQNCLRYNRLYDHKNRLPALDALMNSVNKDN